MNFEPESRPLPDEYAPFYGTYVDLVPDGKCLHLLRTQIADLRQLLQVVEEPAASVCHPPYTWTLKQVVGHLIDTERIFADRLHRFATGEQQAQPGMDQDAYVAGMDYERPTLAGLLDELEHLRKANILLIDRLSSEAWNRCGIASGHSVSVRALVWMLVGHIIHHSQIIHQRLGN